MKNYCIKLLDYSTCGYYVSDDGYVTYDVDHILVSRAYNVLDAACKHWKNQFFANYKVVEFNEDKIRKELSEKAKQD